MMTHWSHNEFHLGDNLIHLHFLRKLALKYPGDQFRHAVQPCHLAQLQEAIEDLPNVQLIRYEDKPLASVNVWKNAEGFWEQHRYRNQFAEFYVEWFECLALAMGLESPIRTTRNLWFDYPKIARFSIKVAQLLDAVHGRNCTPGNDYPIGMCGPRFDILVVNSRPCSGQFRAYDDVEYLTPLIEELAARYKVVVTQPVLRSAEGRGGKLKPAIPCTMDYGLTISEIGTLSLHADHLVMVSTGPSWPTFNVWNADTVKLRLLMLDTEKVDYMPNTVHVGDREQARAVLQQKGLL